MVQGYSNDIKKEVLESLIDNFKEDLEGIEVSEVVYQLYNNDFYIFGTEESKNFCIEYIEDIFNMLEEYNFNYGEQYSDVTNFEKLATLLILQVADEIFGSLERVQEKWNNQLDKKLQSEILAELKIMLEDL